MNEDEVAEGCVPSAEMDFFENTSKDSIPDAKYYLVRPKGSKTVYIMDLKPEYNKGPFYKACEKKHVISKYLLYKFIQSSISM